MNIRPRGTKARSWLSCGAMVGLTLLMTAPCWGQFTNGTGNGSVPARHPVTPPDVDQPITGDLGGDVVFQERRLNQLNAAQHKSMVADTDKLLKLVTELNAEISSTNPSTLTAQQLRKIAEIEKLAHNVKDKMRMSVRGAGTSGQFPDVLYGRPPHL